MNKKMLKLKNFKFLDIFFFEIIKFICFLFILIRDFQKYLKFLFKKQIINLKIKCYY